MWLFQIIERLDDQFETFRHNELMLERWVRIVFAVFYYFQYDLG